MKKIQTFLTIVLIVFSIIVVVLFAVIIRYQADYSFLFGLVVLSAVIYWQLIRYLSILFAEPIYQNEEISAQKFETPIKITETSKRVSVFLCLQLISLVQFGSFKSVSGFVKLVNNSTKKEYSVNLYTAANIMPNMSTLTSMYTFIVRSFADIPAGDYTLFVDTGGKGVPIKSLKVIRKN